MSIRDICTTDVVTIVENESLQKAAQIMRDEHVGALLVVEEGGQGKEVKPLGIVTDRDIVIKVIAEKENIENLSVSEAVEENLVSVKPDAGIHEVLNIMRDKGVRRAPVIDDAQKLIGIISTDDILNLLACEIKDVAGIIQTGQEQEEQRIH